MRVMMKWQPFKSLNGQYRVLEEHRKEKVKVEKPELSSDEVEDINAMLVSLSRGDIIRIRFFYDGQISVRTEVFISVDEIDRIIKCEGSIISFDDLLGIERCEKLSFC